MVPEDKNILPFKLHEQTYIFAVNFVLRVCNRLWGMPQMKRGSIGIIAARHIRHLHILRALLIWQCEHYTNTYLNPYDIMFRYLLTWFNIPFILYTTVCICII